MFKSKPWYTHVWYDFIVPTAPLCGLTKVVITPISRGKNIFKDDEDDLYDDADDAKQLDKILGGSYVTYGEIPWQAGIFFRNHYICSGAIISEFWVISAAHCFRYVHITNLFIC